MPTPDGVDVAVYRVEVGAHRHDGNVASPGFAPPRDVAGPLIVSAAVLLDGFEAEGAGIAAKVAQLGVDLRLELGRFGLRPARNTESRRRSGPPGRTRPRWNRPARSGSADFGRGKNAGPVDPVIGVLVLELRGFLTACGSRRSAAPAACRGGENAEAFRDRRIRPSSNQPRPQGEAGRPRTGRHPRLAWQAGRSAAAAR